MKREACSLTFNKEDEKGLGTFYDELALYNEYKNILFDMTDLSDDDTLVKTPAGGHANRRRNGIYDGESGK